MEAYRDLGEAVLDLFRAELAVVRYDFVHFLKQVMVLLAAAATALLFLVYTPFLVLLTLVDATKRITGWESYWAPSLAVLGMVILGIALAAGVLYLLVVRKMDPPTVAIPRRLDDHKGWWQAKVLETSDRSLDGGRRGRQAGAEEGGETDARDGGGSSAEEPAPSTGSARNGERGDRS